MRSTGRRKGSRVTGSCRSWKSRVRVARKYKGSSLMRRMAYTFLSGKWFIVELGSAAALVAVNTVLLVVPAADLLPPNVGFHFDGDIFSEVHD